MAQLLLLSNQRLPLLQMLRCLLLNIDIYQIRHNVQLVRSVVGLRYCSSIYLKCGSSLWR